MWPFKKKQKAKRMYAGAIVSRLTNDWMTSNASIDTEIKSSLYALRNRVRQLCRDNDYARAALRTIRNNVVGPGIKMQGTVIMKRGGKLDDRLNTLIESVWTDWQKKENCHTSGKLCFQDIERLIMNSLVESGEIIIRKIKQPLGKSKIPFCLEVIEADLLDDQFNGISLEGNPIRLGVELDKWLRPVAYHFHNKHPGDYFVSELEARTGQRKRILAEEIVHLFISDRPGQTRGVPWFASTVMRMRHMAGYEEAEVVAARASACLMGFIETPEGEAPYDGVQDDQRVTDFEPSVIKTLQPGEKMTTTNFNRPGNQFDPFMRAMLRGVASGIGVSYESLSKDYSQSNYSSSRLALLDDRDNWKVLQAWMISNFHQPIFEEWLDLAVLSGEIQIRDYELNSNAYKYPRWIPRGWSWIDPAKEVAAYKDAVRNGFTTLSDVISQSGADIEDVFNQRGREIDMAEELGLVLDSNPAQVNEKGIAQVAEPPPANQETVTDDLTDIPSPERKKR